MFNLMPYVHGRRELDPFREFEKLERELFSSTRPYGFKTDISDKGESFLLEAELPGFKKENINVEVTDGKLTITAERMEETEEKDEKDVVFHRERSRGVFVRSFDISSVEEDDISASYTDGILSLVLPKKKEILPKVRKLDIM